MNIFVLDRNPFIAAEMHCDKHVPKMILETAQMLSTAHHIYESPIAPLVYKKAHVNHPCTIWVRESTMNYDWTWKLFHGLNIEFMMRRNKEHESWRKFKSILGTTPEGIPCKGLTPFAQAMPEEYKNEDAVEAYRSYYIGAKAGFAKWEWPSAKVPFWWNPIKHA
jgi:hypothetical protein